MGTKRAIKQFQNSLHLIYVLVKREGNEISMYQLVKNGIFIQTGKYYLKHLCISISTIVKIMRRGGAERPRTF